MTEPRNQLAELLTGPKENLFFEELGRLVTQYAMAEAAVHYAARRLCSMTEEHGRIIFANMRISDIKERVVGVLALDKYPQEIVTDFEACCAQLKVIGQDRNRLVHRAVDYEQGKLKVSNVITAKILEKAETHEYSLDDLWNMKLDCLSIAIRLFLILDEPKTENDIQALKNSREPWLYKSH